MYFLSPKNKYMLVEPVEQDKIEEEKKAFFIPDENGKTEEYQIVRVIEDSNLKYEPESLVLVPSHLLERIEINGQTNYLITENYVIASVTKLED
jgi:uncharacterized protein YrzB (UPF0473 family)